MNQIQSTWTQVQDATGALAQLLTPEHEGNHVDLKKAETGLDQLLELLERFRRQIENAIYPPEIMMCEAPLCSWVGTSHDAVWNDGDQEYRCPECASSEVTILSPDEAADLANYLDQREAEQIRSVLEYVAAWHAEATHEHA
jgi:hypothetical protein